MEKDKFKYLITSFTSEGEYFATSYPDGVVKIWNTGNGFLLAEWKQSDNILVTYSCMACTSVAKKKGDSVMVALGTSDGDIHLFAVDDVGKVKWESCRRHGCGVIGLAFANKGRSLRIIGTNGKAHEIKTKSGEPILQFKLSKKPISTIAFSNDEKKLVVASSKKTQILKLDDGQELLRLPNDLGPVQHIAISEGVETMVTSSVGEKQLHVLRCDLESKSVSRGPVLLMQHPPSAFTCIETYSGNGDPAVLAVSDSGVVYVWNLKTILEDDISPAKITVEFHKKSDRQTEKHSKKSDISIFAARFYYLEEGQLTVLIAFGSLYSPQFRKVNISQFGVNIVVYASDEAQFLREYTTTQDVNDLASERRKAPSTPGRETKKKRSADDMDSSDEANADTDNGEAMDGILVEDDLNEPTMGEKLATLDLQDSDESKSHEKQESPSQAKPPSADSVNILLIQALHAEDRSLLLHCLYTQDDKVITKSISQLSPTHVVNLLHSLLNIIDSRGAILACALPWLRSLLLQHASKIMSQESSLVALNSLYQLVEARNSTLQPALQLSSRLDALYSGVVEEISEDEKLIPVIYEDNDESDEDDEEESEGVMEADEDSRGEHGSFGGQSDLEGGDDMSD